MREHTNRTGTINASGHKFADLDIIPLRRRHTLPACGGNGGVKRGATILRQPVPHCDHSAQHDRRDLAHARSVLKGIRDGSPNRRRWVQQPANRNLDGGCLAGKQKCRGHRGAVLVRYPFRTPLESMERERVAICLLHEAGDKAKKIGGVSGIEIVSMRLANRFEQMLDNTTQLFAKIELGSTKTLNKK